MNNINDYEANQNDKLLPKEKSKIKCNCCNELFTKKEFDVHVELWRLKQEVKRQKRIEQERYNREYEESQELTFTDMINSCFFSGY